MSTSDVSNYENVTPLVKKPIENCRYEVIDLVMSDIISILGDSGPVSYCPFCVSSFSDKKSLENHLSSVHYAFLWELTTQTVGLKNCPLCSAKFVGHHLVAKHSLLYHGNVIVDAFLQKCGRVVQCLFCQARTDMRNMSYHMEQIHVLEYYTWFEITFNLQAGGVTGLILKAAGTSENNTTSRAEVDDLNSQLKNLNVLSPPKMLRSILKTPSDKKQNGKLPVRRVLSFDDDKENAEIPRIPRRKVKNGRDGPRLSSGRKCSFQCGKCFLYFPNNPQLVLHVKNAHRKLSLNLLHPFYKCGLCGAKFFKCSYLKKHCATHSIANLR